MTTIVCQGLQSCLDSPQLVESRTLRLRLSSSSITPHLTAQPQSFDLSTLKSIFPDAKTNEPAEKCQLPNQPHESQTSKNTEMGGWCFLQSLQNSQSSKLEKEKTYVHPMVKSSSSCLSEKSLKLCTENLGNETGTDMSESGILSNTSETESKSEDFSSRRRFSARKFRSSASPSRNFPPPLTTMSGAESLQIKPHREEGRLIIKAVKSPPRISCFHAERSHGRLRLCFMENYTPTFDSGERVTNQESEICENDNIDAAADDNDDEEEEEEELVERKIEEEKEAEEGCSSEDMDEKNIKMEGKMGMENYERKNNLRRCKEGGGGEHEKNKALMLNWEPFWVATS
ncbi:hypothetical protein G4B88_008347 [Cannabis sativa]|uniref:FAF domain-containing protein n=1 Tax=Cannabis sativa TaxID=3483 RepID=A0A7J6G7Q3_CANSA|nr:hypothetical protein G4B88_008347 [Cannabis sativa]